MPAPTDTLTAAAVLSSGAGQEVREKDGVNHPDARVGNKQPQPVCFATPKHTLYLKAISGFDQHSREMPGDKLITAQVGSCISYIIL